jgi:hypothetical protein
MFSFTNPASRNIASHMKVINSDARSIKIITLQMLINFEKWRIEIQLIESVDKCSDLYRIKCIDWINYLKRQIFSKQIIYFVYLMLFFLKKNPLIKTHKIHKQKVK